MKVDLTWPFHGSVCLGHEELGLTTYTRLRKRRYVRGKSELHDGFSSFGRYGELPPENEGIFARTYPAGGQPADMTWDTGGRSGAS